MKDYNFIKIRKKIKPENPYMKSGIDNTARLFLLAIRENLVHQQRKERFKEWNGYQPQY